MIVQTDLDSRYAVTRADPETDYDDVHLLARGLKLADAHTFIADYNKKNPDDDWTFQVVWDLTPPR